MSTRSYSNTFELRSLENEPLSKSYRNEDTTYDPGKPSMPRRRSWRSRFSGWRGGVVAAIAIASFVLLLNIILAIVAATTWNPVEGLATAFTGDCTIAARWTTAVHLLINLLSSLLLGASNYCMQRLVAPTRKEVDKAHACKKWLDIGMSSIRNLSSISNGRLMLWIALAFSSVPLHFLYNSVVFETIAANYVDFLVVGPEFFTDRNSWNYYRGSDAAYNASWDNALSRHQDTLLNDQYLNRTLFENITGAACLSRYTSAFITSGTGFGVPTPEWRNELEINATNSLLTYEAGSGGMNLQKFNNGPDYSYCLSQIVPSKCQIQFSQTILYIVIACNILKVGLMVLILWRLNHETIVTVGDAIKSFLQKPDHTTEDCCLMSRKIVNKLWKVAVPELRLGQRLQPRRRDPWWVACSARRWGFSLFLYIGAIVAAVVLLKISEDSPVRSGGRNGFGKVSIDYLIDLRLPLGDSSVIPYILLANLPQAIISFIYLTYNGVFTAMLAEREWSQYSTKRASLRVTIPSLGQRSTYFLQLPYTFSVPLLVASVVLHWFISQSIFLARIGVYQGGKLTTMTGLDMYNHISPPGDGVFSAVGYSDVALIASIAWGSLLTATCLLVASICRYPKGLPIGGTNSAVISAACHVKYVGDKEDKVEEDISDRPLKWGVTIPGSREIVGHCCFSSGEVDVPRVGHLYAGCIARTRIA